MAEDAFLFACKGVGQYVNKLIGGEEVVRWIQYEFETLRPLLERIETEGSSDDYSEQVSRNIQELTRRTRDVIRRAEDLTETYTKRMIQSKVGYYSNPINSIGISLITKKLHKIRDEIGLRSEELSESAKQLVRESLSTPYSASATAAEHEHHSNVSVPFHLRRCVHYFVLFPPDYQVPARRLIVLWVADGLIHSKKHDNHSVEKIAEGYLDELIHLGMINGKRNRVGKLKSCMMDAGRRNSLLEEVKKDNFLHEDRDGKDKIHRLVDSNGNTGGGDSFIQINGSQTATKFVRNYVDVISFLSFNTQEGSKPGEDIGDFLRKCISAGCFIWLRVLDLERVFRPKLPDTLGKLIALKYLGLRWSYLEKLPDTVDRLLNLQVLDVKHTYITVLPRSIWSMEYLRHLYLSEAYRTRFPVPPSRVTLTALQTLWGAFVDEDTCVVQGLDRLLNIRKLGLSCRYTPSIAEQMSEQLEAINKWISNLKFLESLRLKSRDESGRAAHLHLTTLEGNKNLSTVYLLGKLKPFLLCELPLSLTDITLSGSAFDFDPMEFLGKLPNLVALRLLGHSVVYEKMYCSRRGFLRLKLLWIWNLDSLKKFEAEEGSLPCLKELEIRSCKDLTNIPDQLQHVQDLEIKLTSMPTEIVERAGRNYADVLFLAKDDQYILKNPPPRFLEEETSL